MLIYIDDVTAFFSTLKAAFFSERSLVKVKKCTLIVPLQLLVL